ncbi:hypothetical protein OF83DRAFT_870762 [Amylostereum chailletii]|nr:hypothetical protein OF83DRAFT_870762 [Amylostereum chailletii]
MDRGRYDDRLTGRLDSCVHRSGFTVLRIQKQILFCPWRRTFVAGQSTQKRFPYTPQILSDLVTQPCPDNESQYTRNRPADGRVRACPSSLTGRPAPKGRQSLQNPSSTHLFQKSFVRPEPRDGRLSLWSVGARDGDLSIDLNRVVREKLCMSENKTPRRAFGGSVPLQSMPIHKD